MIKNRIKLYKRLSVSLDLFVKVKYKSSAIILFVGVRDLLSDLNNYANWRYASETVNDVSASSGISSP